MVRHTNTWVFNIASENWDQCVEGAEEAAVHGEENVGRPVHGIRTGAPAAIDDLEPGDIAIVRKKNHGVGGIWEVRNVVTITPDGVQDLFPDAEYETIIYCDPIQRALDPIYTEDWEGFSNEFNETSHEVKANIRGAISNLRPEYKERYLSELRTHDGVTTTAAARLESLLEETSAYWDMVREKRTLAESFLDVPSKDTFENLLDPDHFWSQLDRMYEYDIETIFETWTAGEIAATIMEALDNDKPEVLNDIPRFGWGKTTELLRALAPEQYAILNDRAIAGMEALGYEPPERGSATPEEYAAFVAAGKRRQRMDSGSMLPT